MKRLPGHRAPGRGGPRDTVPPVRVPRNDKPLAPVTAARVCRLRDHLLDLLGNIAGFKGTASPRPPEPSGVAARVATTACALCGGWCCEKGGDDAFLDDQTLARVSRDRPDLDERALVRIYLDRVPASAYQDSCLFHGERGCALERSLRSDLCNTYFCRGLGAYLKSAAPAVPTAIIAGEGDKARIGKCLDVS